MKRNGFPNNFLIGGATADFQYEGGFKEGNRGLLSHDFVKKGTASSRRKITVESKDGKLSEIDWEFDDVPDGAEAILEEGYSYPSMVASDFYHHYKDDISLMADAGFNVFRFSVCWSRIYQTGLEDCPNKEGLQFYDDVINECKKHNIEPLITICHDELPFELCKKYDGWSSRKTIDCYVKFARTLFEYYGDRVKYWVTFNEVNALKGYAQLGIHKQDRQSHYQAIHHIFVASSKAIEIGKTLYPNNKFTAMFALSELYPETCKSEDVLACYLKRRDSLFFVDVMTRGEYPNYTNEIIERKDVSLKIEPGDLEVIKNNTLDFISFSYYRSGVVKQNSTFEIMGGEPNPYLKRTPWGYAIDPIGLRYCLNELYDRYQKPLFVIENGYGMVDELTDDKKVHDTYRIDYLAKHFEQMLLAINNDGIPVIGYTMWGPIDLVSLSTGEMKKRYGLIYVDKNDDDTGDLKRIKKDSYWWFRKVIDSNGTDLS